MANDAENGKKGEDKKKKKSRPGVGKWREIKAKLKSKGVTNTSFMDFVRTEIELPSFPEDLTTAELECGCFNWTLSFLNKQIHGKTVLEEQQRDEADAALADAFRGQNAAKDNKKKKSFNHLRETKRQMREKERNLMKRPGYILRVKCEPNLDVKLGQKLAALRHWRVIAVVKTNWKPFGDKEKMPIHKNIIFDSESPETTVRYFSPLALSKPKTLVVRIWVVRVNNVDLIPAIDFKKSENKICLRAHDDDIFVHKEALAIHSPVFREQILQGLGSDENNPIIVPEEFSPSLIRVAFRAIFTKNKIQCHNVVDLLKFGTLYKIGHLIGLIEESLIHSRRCKHFGFARKIKLAQEFGLCELMNTFAKQQDTIEAIENKLKDKEILDGEFKDMLTRKLTLMTAKREELRQKSREKRKQAKVKKSKKVKARTETRQSENTAKLNQLNIATS